MTGSRLQSDPRRQRAALMLTLVAPALPADRERALRGRGVAELDALAELLAEINVAVGIARGAAMRERTVSRETRESRAG